MTAAAWDRRVQGWFGLCVDRIDRLAKDGGGRSVPPPPKCLQELGRFLSSGEDVSGDETSLQPSLNQRVTIRSRAPSAS